MQMKSTEPERLGPNEGDSNLLAIINRQLAALATSHPNAEEIQIVIMTNLGFGSMKGVFTISEGTLIATFRPQGVPGANPNDTFVCLAFAEGTPAQPAQPARPSVIR